MLPECISVINHRTVLIIQFILHNRANYQYAVELSFDIPLTYPEV